MKLKLLFACIILSLLSCSNDDSGPGTEKKLLKTIATSLSPNNEAYTVTDFQNNLPVKSISYSENGIETYRSEYIYDGQYRLAEEKIYVYYPEIAGLDHYEYDNSGRIIKITDTNYLGQEEPVISTTTFLYNMDGSIAVTRPYYGTSILYMGNDGKFDKDIFPDGRILMANFFSGNIIKTTVESNTLDFTYEMQHPVKGTYDKYRKLMFGTVTDNFIAIYGLTAYDVFADNIWSQHHLIPVLKVVSMNLMIRGILL